MQSSSILKACTLATMFFVGYGAVAAIAPLKTITVGKQPSQLAVNPAAHLLYVVNDGDDTVSVIDTEALVVKKVVSVGSNPTSIASNPAANLVYIANRGSGTLTVLSPTTTATWKVGGAPAFLTVDSILNQLYVLDENANQIVVFNATTGKAITSISTGTQPTAMAVNTATHALFVACTGSSGSVVVIDGTHNQVLTTVNGIPTFVTSIVVDSNSNVAGMVSPTQNAYVTINAANGYSVFTQNGGNGNNDPIAVSFDPGGLFFYMDSNFGAIWFADESGEIEFANAYYTNELGGAAMAVNPSTNQVGALYNSSLGWGFFIINLTNPIDTIYLHDLPTGTHPSAVVFDPFTSRVFVSNTGDGTVSAADVSPVLPVAAYEGNINGNIDYNYTDVNPATGNVYTVRFNNVYAISESAAGKGYTGGSDDSAGVTTIPIQSIYSECVAVNAATNKIYVGDTAGFFYSINGSTNVATVVSALATADIRAVAIDNASDQVIAWDYAGNNVYILDSATDTVQYKVPVQPGGNATLQVDPIHDLVYLADLNIVYVINPANGTVVTTIPVPQTVVGSAINPAASRLYTISASGTHDLIAINTQTDTVVSDIQLPQVALSVAVNPYSGNYYAGYNDSGAIAHVQEYDGKTNALIMDFSETTYPVLTGAVTLAVDPLTDTVYAGAESGANPVAAIDERSGSVSAINGSGYESAARILSLDLGSRVLAGAGNSYTTLWFPTSDVTGGLEVPITLSLQGVPDSQTIATTPLFRTHSTQPTIKITATSNFSMNPNGLVPRHVFLALDGWQAAWTAEPLTPKNGTNTSSVQGKVPVKLTTGRHIIYAYATNGDVSTVQDSQVGSNSPVISPIGFVVFTVEK